MKPFRSLRKKRLALTLTSESFCLKMAYVMMKEGKLKNSKDNRKPVWSVQKSQSYMFSLFVSRTAPTEFLVRETEDDDGELVLEIYDGMNRLNSIFEFFEGKFPIIFGNTKVFYHELPSPDRGMLDATLCQFMKLRNCPVFYACEIAEKRNEGTPMTIGEKTNLLISVGTPRSQVLEQVMESAPYMALDDDRASGLKVVAQLIQSIEMKRGVDHDGFKLTDYHFDVMRSFYKSEDSVSYIDTENLVNAFEQVGQICDDAIPECIKEQMVLLNGKKAPSRVLYFYLAVVAVVMGHLRHNNAITERVLEMKFKTICDRSANAKNSGRTFTLGGCAIDGMY